MACMLEAGHAGRLKTSSELAAVISWLLGSMGPEDDTYPARSPRKWETFQSTEYDKSQAQEAAHNTY